MKGLPASWGKGVPYEQHFILFNPKSNVCVSLRWLYHPAGHWKNEVAGYAAIPILNRQGEYRGTLKEGDLLWAMKNMCNMDMRQAECRRIMEIPRRKDNIPVRITASMHDLIERASNQNFVPVIDDYRAFIGIITRKAIINYCQGKLFPEDWCDFA